MRFLDLKVNDAYTNMAIDEALTKARGEWKAPDTFRLYMWKPSAVTLGYFQSVEDEVDLDALKRYGIDLNRRISGGGAVLNSATGEITYSIIMDENDSRISKDPVESYRYLCHGIVDGLGILGIKADFKPINDIVVGAKKRALGNNNSLIFITGLIFLAIIIGYVYLRKRPKSKLMTQVPKKVSQIDIEDVFRENPTLRTDEKAVLRYIHESGGVFITDIRNQFDMPKSSAWRMMKRLEEEGLIETSMVDRETYIQLRRQIV